MKVYIDASGDEGQIKKLGTSRFYTLGVIIIDSDDGDELVDRIAQKIKEEFGRELGRSFFPELKWHKLDERGREFVTQKLLTRQEILLLVISVDKFSKESGWQDLRINEAQFRTYVLRAMLWLICSHANLSSHYRDISLEFDQELAEAFQTSINREARRIKSKKISVAVGVESKNSFGIQIADCLAGCYNHYREGKSKYYELFRERVCEVELVTDKENPPEIKQVMRITDLAKLLR